jgi:hypothetical protein
MAAIDVSGGGGAGISLTKDIFVNTSLIGAFDATEDVDVFLEDTGGNPITPTSSVLVGNDLTITANIPNPSGVALQFPKGSIRTSYQNYDSGWRTQNNIYNYIPPAYPSKFAKLDYSAGANWWYTLATPLTVNGVSSTRRFVDLSGVTGLMISRTPFNVPVGPVNYQTFLNNQYALSVTINGNVYSQWFAVGVNEWNAVFGNVCPSGNWIDPSSGLSIFPSGVVSPQLLSQPFNASGFNWTGISGVASGNDFTSININAAANWFYTFRDGSSLIS